MYLAGFSKDYSVRQLQERVSGGMLLERFAHMFNLPKFDSRAL